MLRSILVAVLLPAIVGAEDLPAFLRAATESMRPKTAVRAFGKAVTTSPEGTVEDELAIVQSPGGDLYLELRKSRTRALILAAGKEAFVSNDGGKAEPFALDAAFDATHFTREDLHPFDSSRYAAPRISDLGAYELTVTLEPKPTQYALIVMTFDRQKKALKKTLYYRDAPNNLVKMRQDADLVSVGDGWLSGSIAMQDFQLRAKTSFSLRWEAAAAPAGIFERASLDKPSPIAWPGQ